MDYGHIVQRSFHIAWRYKALWIFGLFAAGSSSFNIDLNQSPFQGTGPDAMPTFNPDMFTPELIFSLLALGGILAILFLLAFCISQPALVDATNRIERGGTYSFGASFSAGIDYFARTLGLWLVMAAIALAVFLVVLVLMLIVIAIAESGGGGGIAALLGVLGILAMIPLFLGLYYFITTLGSLAQRAIVVRDIGIGDAIAESWYLIKNNFMSTIVVFLIFFGISIGLGFVSLIVFLAFNSFLQLLIPPADFGWQTYIVIGLVVGLPISLIMGGFFGTFFSNLYTLFYFELVDPNRSRPEIATAMPSGPAPPSGPPQDNRPYYPGRPDYPEGTDDTDRPDGSGS